MADYVDIKVEGVEKLLENLKRYQIVKTEACRNALKEIGFKIATDSKRFCPVLTGRLRSSLSVNWSGSGMARGKVDSKASAEDGIGRPEGKLGLVVVVGSNVQYAEYVESGTRHMPARHYLFRSYHGHEKEVEKRIRDILGKKD